MRRTVVTGVALLLVVLWLTSGLTTVQAAPKTYRIDLPVRTFTPDANQLQFFQQRDVSQPQAVLIQFNSHPDQAAKRSLSSNGVHLQQYIGGGAWVAWLEANVESNALSSADVRWAGEYMPEDRVAPRVTSQEMPQWAVAGDEILLAVQFAKQLDESYGEALLAQLGAIAGDYVSPLNTWYTQISPDLVDELTQDPGVMAVDYIAPPMGMVNAGVRAAMHVDEVNNPPFDLRGNGVTVCVYDGGLVDISHPDFENRGTQGETGGISSHPTHVAGTVLGNGADPYRGMAPEATLISYEYESCNPYCLYDSPQDIFENYQEALQVHGAHIFTNSIGSNTASNGYDCDWEGDYELTSALLDSIVRGAVGEPVIVGFAAGNERGAGRCGTTYSTLGVPAGAKNVISVGASDDNDNMSSFSSWGPSDDGRIKPDVSAPGVSVVSCNSGGGYTTMSGTSMATPAVAGVNALLVEQWGISAMTEFPNPPTVKAILCNSAEDLFNHGPDYQFGYGRVDAVRAVETIQNFGYLESSVGDNGLVTQTFTVPAGLDVLKVTAAWADPPASYLATVTLINDLDLVLVDPSGIEYDPWILDWNNPSSPATTGTNVRDNVEQVEVMNPAAGQWTLRISGTDVPVGPQDFSVAANVPLAEGVMTITGTVTRQNGGQAIAGATVTVMGSGAGTVTDANGDYFMYLPVSETIQLKAEAPGFYYQHAYIIPEGQESEDIDFQLITRPLGQIAGIVRDSNGSPVVGATVTVEEIPLLNTTTNAQGRFQMLFPTGDVFTVTATDGSVTGQVEAYTNQGQSVNVSIFLLEDGDKITGPSEQVNYVAVQSTDNHVFSPTFNWRAIDPLEGGQGTRVTLTGEEDAVVIDLPFTVGYYGNDYTQLTVNENGFFCFGDVTGDDEPADYSNTEIPGSDGPPAMVAPFWEDFRAAETNLSYYHDATAGIFIVEWYDSRQWPDDGTRETFQVIFNDRDFPNPPPYLPHDENTRILFQYADVNDLGNATVGIESPDEEAGLGLLYFDADGDGSYAETVSTITDGTAILFYVPRATVQGAVALDVPNPDIDITVSSPYGEIPVNQDGTYSITVMPATFELVYSAPGYETVDRRFKLNEYQTVTQPQVMLAKLYPPQNLVYQDNGGSIALSWDAPVGGAVEDFIGYYRVYEDGIEQALVQNQTGWTDDSPGADPNYWVTAIYAGGESDSSNHAIPGMLAGIDEMNLLPEEFAISEAYPNPFNPSTSIEIALPEASLVQVAVYDILGREVVRLAQGERYNAGYHRLTWDAAKHASGVYFLQVQAGPEKAVRKLVLLK